MGNGIADAIGAPDVTWIDLSEFGDSYKGGRVWGPVGLALTMFLAGFAAFAGLVFLWFLVSQLGPAFESAGGVALVIMVILACVVAVFFVIRFRVRHETGVSEFVSGVDLSPGDLDRIVPPSGVPLRKLLERVKVFAASLGPRVKIKQTADPAMRKKIQQQTYIAWGVVGGSLLIFLFISPVIGGAFVLASCIFFMRAAQARQPSIAEVRAQDKRRPILFLRSFRDDRLMAPQRQRYFIWVVNAARRFEQAIAGSFETFGPLIAIGEPGEKLPQIGAARTYLSDREWQEAVLGWIQESLLIVMIAGSTQWIQWELHRILEKNRSGHLLILIPPDRGPARFWQLPRVSSRKDRWTNVLASLADTEWSSALRSIDIEGLLLVQLKPAGRVNAIKSDNTYVQAYLLAIAVAIDNEFDTFEAKAA